MTDTPHNIANLTELEQQYRQLGRRLELDILEGRLNFPTAFDVTLRIKKLADHPDTTLEELARVVMAEPVLSAKTVKMANSVQLNPYGQNITNVSDALKRIGLQALRCLAFAVTAEQLVFDTRSPRLRALASGLWLRTVDVACWAFALARTTRVCRPDNALFAAMLRNIGQFFLLSRANEFPDAENNLESFARFVQRWHEPVREALTDSFDLPEVIEAAVDNVSPAALNQPPTDLLTLLPFAESISQLPNPFDRLQPEMSTQPLASIESLPEDILALIETAREAQQDMLAVVGR